VDLLLVNETEDLFTVGTFVGVEHEHLLEDFTTVRVQTRRNWDPLLLYQFESFHYFFAFIEVSTRQHLIEHNAQRPNIALF
jgi:hypothetical protein